MLKIRRNRAPAPHYGCPINEAVQNLLGGAWTPTVIWSLSGGPRRFSELRIDMPGISAKVLTRRLRDLTDLGVVRRLPVPDTSPPSVDYELTDLGLELCGAVETVMSVGHRLKERLGSEFPLSRKLRLAAQQENRVFGHEVGEGVAGELIA